LEQEALEGVPPLVLVAMPAGPHHGVLWPMRCLLVARSLGLSAPKSGSTLMASSISKKQFESKI